MELSLIEIIRHYTERRNIQAAFTRWYKQRHRRKGSFWAGRFQSTESQNPLESQS